MIFDPLLLISIMFFHIGNRYLKIEITKVQEKILLHPYTQFFLYVILVYYSTRDILFTIIIVIASYLLLFVLFNEKSKYHILSKEWLKKENLLTTTDSKEVANSKETYINNIALLHNY